MNQQSAIALLQFVNRAIACNVPTTLPETEQLQAAFGTIEAVANGRATVEVKPVEQPKPDA